VGGMELKSDHHKFNIRIKGFYLLYMKKHGIAIATSSLSSDFTTNKVVNLTVGIFQFTSLGKIDSRSHL